MSGLKETFLCSFEFSGTGVTRNMILLLKSQEDRYKNCTVTTNTSGGDCVNSDQSNLAGAEEDEWSLVLCLVLFLVLPSSTCHYNVKQSLNSAELTSNLAKCLWKKF